MGQSKLEIAITALNQATTDIDRLTESLKNSTQAQEQQNQKAKEGATAQTDYKNTLGGTVEELTGFSLEAISVAAAAGAIVEVAKAGVDAFEELGLSTEKLTFLTGANAEEASKMIAVSEHYGVSTDELTRALEAAIRKGYSPTIEGLRQMGEEYRSIQDPIARSKFLIDTFGRSGADLAEMLSATDDQIAATGDEVTKMGVVMGADGVQKAVAYRQSMTELNDEFEAIKLEIGGAVVPVVSDYIRVSIEATQKQKEQNLSWLAAIPPLNTLYLGVQMLSGLQKTNTQETQQETVGMGDLQRAEATTTAATDLLTTSKQKQKDATVAAKDAQKDENEQIKIVTTSFGKLTEQMVFNQASQGLSAKDTADLALKMGLMNQETYDALIKTQKLNAEYLAGHTTLISYEDAIMGIRDAEMLLTDKAITITVNQRTNTFTENTGGVTMTNTRNLPKGSGSGSGGPSGGRAIGGKIGSGRTLVGEMGPEYVDLDPGSSGQVVNNYETNYNLTAHYPTYQDPNAARNDLVMLTMLKNPGAAKWARR